MKYALESLSLSRRYAGAGSKVALDDVSFGIPTGQVVALLGENGAGKTTFAKIASTLLLPSSGDLRINGNSVLREARSVRRDVSTVFGGDRGFYEVMTGRENIRYFSLLAGIRRAEQVKRVDRVLDEVGLLEVADRRVETYSKGMKQRLHIACAFVREPSVLLLDEPTIGLDPTEADRLRKTIAGLRARDVTVILTSHYLLDVERLADRVVMLQSGKVVSDTTLSGFAAIAESVATVTLHLEGTDSVVAEVARNYGAVVEGDGDAAIVKVSVRDWSAAELQKLQSAISELRPLRVEFANTALEDAFSTLQRSASGV